MKASLSEHIVFVKNQVAYHERHLDKAVKRGEADDSVHEYLLNGHKQLLATLESFAAHPDHPALNDSGSSSTQDPLSALLQNSTQINPTMLDGLPPELVEQLQISDADRFQWQVVDLINRTPTKIISLEVLLIALFHTTGKILDRTELATRIYRLTRKGVLYSVEGKKGWYTTVKSAAITQEPDTESEMEPEVTNQDESLV